MGRAMASITDAGFHSRWRFSEGANSDEEIFVIVPQKGFTTTPSRFYLLRVLQADLYSEASTLY